MTPAGTTGVGVAVGKAAGSAVSVAGVLVGVGVGGVAVWVGVEVGGRGMSVGVGVGGAGVSVGVAVSVGVGVRVKVGVLVDVGATATIGAVWVGVAGDIPKPKALPPHTSAIVAMLAPAMAGQTGLRQRFVNFSLDQSFRGWSTIEGGEVKSLVS